MLFATDEILRVAPAAHQLHAGPAADFATLIISKDSLVDVAAAVKLTVRFYRLILTSAMNGISNQIRIIPRVLEGGCLGD